MYINDSQYVNLNLNTHSNVQSTEVTIRKPEIFLLHFDMDIIIGHCYNKLRSIKIFDVVIMAIIFH